MDSSVRTVEVKAGQKASENVLVVTNKAPTGEITLTKYNDDKSATVAGTTYHVTSNTGYVNDVTTNESGKIHLTGLKLGTYTFVETHAADGYLLNGEPITVTLSYKDQHTAIITASTEQINKEPTASISLKKRITKQVKHHKAMRHSKVLNINLLPEKIFTIKHIQRNFILKVKSLRLVLLMKKEI